MRLDEITRAAFQEAVRIYLEEAYGKEGAPPEVRKRLKWPKGATLKALASGPGAPGFERSPADVPLRQCDHIRVRLGNRGYPHMKLSADRVPETDEWVLTVDCHDRDIVGRAPAEQREVLEALFRVNAEVKGRIERRWTEAGLPTFENFIRRRLGTQGG